MKKSKKISKVAVAGTGLLMFSTLLAGPSFAITGPNNTTPTPTRVESTVKPSVKPTEDKPNKRVVNITATPGSDSEKDEDKNGSRSGKVPKNLVQKCDRVTLRVDEITKQYKENHSENVNRYRNLVQKVENIISKAKSKGVDVSVLESDTNALKEAINNLETRRSMNIAALNKTLNIQCGVERGTYKQAFDEAKKNQRQIKEDYKKVLELLKKLKADLQALRLALKAQLTPGALTTLTPKPSTTQVPTTTGIAVTPTKTTATPTVTDDIN
jgi:hypothetical protein